MSLLQILAANVDAEFKAALPAINEVIADMVSNATTWQANPVVKATEAAVAIVNPVAALDMAAVIGAASLVQALWQVYGQAAPTPVAALGQIGTVTSAQVATPVVAAVASAPSAAAIQVDADPSHM